MPIRQLDLQSIVQSHDLPILQRQAIGEANFAARGEPDEVGVERTVDMSSQTKAIERVAPLFGTRLVEWLDMAGFQNSRGPDAGDSAPSLPITLDGNGKSRLILAQSGQSLNFGFFCGWRLARTFAVFIRKHGVDQFRRVKLRPPEREDSRSHQIQVHRSRGAQYPFAAE